MKTHDEIDRRSLVLAKRIVEKIDRGHPEKAVAQAAECCRKWAKQSSSRDQDAWLTLLEEPWSAIRALLLDPGLRGKQLRQSNPFGFVLTPRERWAIYRNWRDDEAA